MLMKRREMIGRGLRQRSRKSFPKVLIATPLAEHKYYCINDFIKNVEAIDYPNYDFIIVDNSPNKEAHEVVKEHNPDVRVEYVPFSGTTRSSQADAYNFIREVFLAGDYDYLFTLESDLFPREFIIHELMANDKDICGAIYLIMNGEGVFTIPCVTTGKFIWTGDLFREGFVEWTALDGELKRIHGGCGLGCTLIKRKVIEELGFRYDTSHADTYFHRDAHRLSFETWIDTGLMISHYPSFYPEHF